MPVALNLDSVVSISKSELIKKYKSKIENIFSAISTKTAAGSEMTGWIRWIFQDHTELFASIKKIKNEWKKDGIKHVVVIGTGGSYIGSKAALNFVNNEFENENFEFTFVPSFSERYIGSVLKKLEKEAFAIVVISKSGTTLESAISFRLFRDLLFKQKSEKYYQYIIAVTDKEKGTLCSLSKKNKIRTFVIEDDIGGRYSALTSVGLVPMILSGICPEEIMEGAKQAYLDNFHCDIEKNLAALYASYRHYFFEEENLVMECIASYDPQLDFTLEKMKQLFAESEGKNNKGIMPVLLNFTPDLHSVGQLLQDGLKKFFETILVVKKSKFDLKIMPSVFDNDDSLDWLSGKSLKEINECARVGTISAHKEKGKINNLVIEMDDWTAKSFGYFYFWICLVAMFSAYLFEVNPFDQPGVEAYKAKMFDLLKK